MPGAPDADGRSPAAVGSRKLTNVYLAGKIGKRDWRFSLFDEWPEYGEEAHPIKDGFRYVGPYFVNCDHGCYHGPDSHGRGAGARPDLCMGDRPSREHVASKCEYWLSQAETVFAWIDATDCYGTIAELGMAHSLNIPTFLAFDTKTLSEKTRQDMWFAEAQAFGAIWASQADMAWNSFVAKHRAAPLVRGTQVRPVARSQSEGFIYVMKSPHGYKIGKTRSLKDRHKLFSVKLPFKVEIVLSLRVGDMSRAETALHRLFRDKRLEGEWFQLDSTDISAIEALGESGFMTRAA